MLPSLLLQWGHVKAALKGLDGLWEILEDDHHGQDHPLTPETIQGFITRGKGQHQLTEASQKALHIDNLTIQPGEKIGVLGPIGVWQDHLIATALGHVQTPRRACVT
jgi:ATP-binding cassette, subfamily C, bacterial LapB